MLLGRKAKKVSLHSVRPKVNFMLLSERLPPFKVASPEFFAIMGENGPGLLGGCPGRALLLAPCLGRSNLLTEQQVARSWNSLFSKGPVDEKKLEKAESLLKHLRPESPLHYRLSKELEEIRQRFLQQVGQR